uniref:Single stranded DNA binding protein 3b n=1 Tax=Haplochromis burtoni TaxID=8153 RepID=A0A3Q3CYQ3_HAPBU
MKIWHITKFFYTHLWLHLGFLHSTLWGCVCVYVCMRAVECAAVWSTCRDISTYRGPKVVCCMPPAFFQSFMSPRFAGGPRGPPIQIASQPPGGGPGHPNLGPMQRMSGPRGMGPMGPGPQNFRGGMRPPHNTMGPGMPGVNMGPGMGRPLPNPNNANSMPYSSPSPGVYGGASGGGGPPGTPIMPSPADSNNSGDNLYTMINTGPGNRNNFPMGPGSDGPLGAMAGMEPHHMNGSLGSGDMDGMNKNSPNNLSGITNPPGTLRDDGELSGNFLHSFQSENYSSTMTMSV